MATFFRSTACFVSFAAFLFAGEVTTERIRKADREPHNWLSYGRDYRSWRYSPLEEINRENVKKLVPVWAFETGVDDGGLQCTPLVVDGVMYITSSWNRVFALDAATGEEIWHYYYQRATKFPGLFGGWNRGVAVGHGLVFMGTMDNHLVALDAKTGREVWNVEIEDSKQCGCSTNGAPLVVKDKVIQGVTASFVPKGGFVLASAPLDIREGEDHRVLTGSIDNEIPKERIVDRPMFGCIAFFG